MVGGESRSESMTHREITQTEIIRGLPDDISLACLARLPMKYHTVLKCVSRRWRDLVCSEEWHAYRKKHNLLEPLIYALCRDKFEQACIYVLDPNSPGRQWKRIHEFPPRCLKRKGMGFEALGKKIYLFGGCSWSEDATDEVYCYDAYMNKWTEATSSSTARCYFACEVLEEKIYAIGGLGSKSNAPQSWDTYDPHTNDWKSYFDANIVPEIEDLIVMDGKIYIRSSISSLSPCVCAVVYDPSSGTWQPVDADMASGWQGPAVVVDGALFVLDQRSGAKLTMWQNDNREWVPVGKMSTLFVRPPCQLVAIGKSIFIVGKGRRTAVFDADKARNIEGVMVGSSLPKLAFGDDSDDDILSCKCLSI